MTNAERLLKGAPYKISSPFGPRVNPVTHAPQFHNGVGYATYGEKVPCHAPTDGVVRKTGKDSYGALFVYVEHRALERFGLYYHLDSIDVKVGQAVDEGAQVGVVGSTGRSTGVHLHFSWIKANAGAMSYYQADYEDFEKYAFPTDGGSEEEMEKVYKRLEDLPAYLRPEIKKLMDAGALRGDQAGDVNLTENMARALVIGMRYVDRALEGK
jgi:murein DD-endopeptidase MepM/ murein hydrolase activator NlpD